MIARFDELLGRRVSMRASRCCASSPGRSCSSTCAVPLGRARRAIYSDAFYEPYASWYPELPSELYVGLLWLGALAAVCMTLGLLTRIATATTFAIVAYNLFLSTTHFHNNRAYLVIVLGLLTVAPCGQGLSLDAWLRRRRGLRCSISAPAWPLWLLRFECAVVYGASGFSKLVDPDWFGGTVTWQRVDAAQDQLDALPWLAGVRRDGPRFPHRGGEVRRAHRAVHRARPVVARHALRRRMGRGRLPRVDRGVSVRAGLLAARHRRAVGLGRAVDS